MNAAEDVSEYAAQALHPLCVANVLLGRVRRLPISGKPVRLSRKLDAVTVQKEDKTLT